MPISIPYEFNVEGIDPFVAGSAPLPGGWYIAAISGMEVKENSAANSGHNLACTYSVLDGEYKVRKFFNNLNLWHATSSQAVEIAQKQLSSIGHAVGVLAGADLGVLAEVPMLVELELTAPTEDRQNPNTGETIKGRGPQNRIIQHKTATEENCALYLYGQPAGGAAPGTPAPNQAAQAAKAAAAPAMNPAAAKPAAAPASAPAAAASAPAGGPAVPPWQRAKAAA